MRSLSRARVIATAAVAAAVLVVSGCASDLNISAVATDNSEAYAINEAEMMVGTNGFGSATEAFVRRPDRSVLLLGNNALTGVNHDGVAVGSHTVSCGTNCLSPRAVRWTEATGPVELQYAGGGVIAGAINLNDDGVIVGWAYFNNITTPTYWPDGADGIALPMPVGAYGYAKAISASGDIAGVIIGADGVWHATYWDAATHAYHQLESTTSNANDINDLGVIVGSVEVAGITRPAMWAPPTYTTEYLNADAFGGEARGINNSGEVVGETYPQGTVTLPRAALWSSAGGPINLRTLGGTTSRANAISDNGDIVGMAETEGGTRRAARFTR